MRGQRSFAVSPGRGRQPTEEMGVQLSEAKHPSASSSRRGEVTEQAGARSPARPARRVEVTSAVLSAAHSERV
jgi:hypothetical protein